MIGTSVAAAETAKTPAISPPRWMTRSEKHDFRRILEARKATGNPVSATEFDAVCDYIAARSRIQLLRRMIKVAVAQCRGDPLDRYCRRPFGSDSNQRHAMTLMRQCEASTAHCRRLARDLKLIGTDD